MLSLEASWDSGDQRPPGYKGAEEADASGPRFPLIFSYYKKARGSSCVCDGTFCSLKRLLNRTSQSPPRLGLPKSQAAVIFTFRSIVSSSDYPGAHDRARLRLACAGRQIISSCRRRSRRGCSWARSEQGRRNPVPHTPLPAFSVMHCCSGRCPPDDASTAPSGSRLHPSSLASPQTCCFFPGSSSHVPTGSPSGGDSEEGAPEPMGAARAVKWAGRLSHTSSLRAGIWWVAARTGDQVLGPLSPQGLCSA